MFDLITLYNGTVVFSPWFPRGGDFLRLTAECVEMTGGAGFSLVLYHKNSDEAGDGANVDTAGTPLSLTFSGTGRVTVDWAKSATILGFKELVRYYIKVSGSGTAKVQFRMLPPIWYDDVFSS